MDRFEILLIIGEGAYSTVYKVKRIVDNEIYALKKVKMKGLTTKEKQNALNEVRLLASVKSDFVIGYKEAFFNQEDQTLCLVMEYADQGDLYQKISLCKKNDITFEEIDIWKIFIHITKGLHDLHQYNILYRDMKSANVFLFRNGNAKLGDLNVSKVARRGLGHTQTGTPYYASPEVWRDNPYDCKSDIWSLGCVTYEMIMLKTPFRAESMEGLYHKIMKGKYPQISSKFSNDLSTVISLLLTVSSTLRPTTTQILDLQAVKTRIEFFNIFSGQNANSNTITNRREVPATDEKTMLETIRMPKKLVVLNNKLPTATYEDNSSDSFKNKSYFNAILPTIISLKPQGEYENIICTQEGDRENRKSIKDCPKTIKMKIVNRQHIDLKHQNIKMIIEEKKGSDYLIKAKNLNKMKELNCIYKQYNPQLFLNLYLQRGLKNNHSDISLFGNLNYFFQKKAKTKNSNKVNLRTQRLSNNHESNKINSQTGKEKSMIPIMKPKIALLNNKIK